MPEVRRYRPSDAASWLRCRLLAFFDTRYFDDVWTRRPDAPAVQLVAVEGDVVVGILDVEIEDTLATIDTIAVHPDFRRNGVASTLLEAALALLPEHVETLDAWTREDPDALAWYRGRGFAESDHYLHVYKGWADLDEGWETPEHLSRPVTAFCHAKIEHEAELREQFARVYVCRRFALALTPARAGPRTRSPIDGRA